MEKDKAHKAWRNVGKLDGECTGGKEPEQTVPLKWMAALCIPVDCGMIGQAEAIQVK
ncbi:hypothetical protein ABER60_09465 [Heyndrickxia coagulans]|uniref:hypothetical protein n=1 Tax=Heyndrickxia coagulans TaxID=1398 RepID=UPI001414FBD5|nr:hypothetical protein [Heyndrickxia coagulans]MBF8417708.1 hypothetical protein [Heyndrickxia coagulans]